MRMKRWFILGMLISVVWTTPVAAQQPAKTQGPQAKALGGRAGGGKPAKAPPSTAPSEYVIGPEDMLDISVWEEPRFSRAVPVRPDGKISLPLLNDIQAAGLTPEHLAASIAEMLKKYVSQPQVTVTVTAVNSQRVYIMGQVNRPGAMNLLPDMTVLQALASAGGFTQFANEKGIYILRVEDGKPTHYPFNYKETIRGSSMKQNIILKPGDTIVIP